MGLKIPLPASDDDYEIIERANPCPGMIILAEGYENPERNFGSSGRTIESKHSLRIIRRTYSRRSIYQTGFFGMWGFSLALILVGMYDNFLSMTTEAYPLRDDMCTATLRITSLEFSPTVGVADFGESLDPSTNFGYKSFAFLTLLPPIEFNNLCGDYDKDYIDSIPDSTRLSGGKIAIIVDLAGGNCDLVTKSTNAIKIQQELNQNLKYVLFYDSNRQWDSRQRNTIPELSLESYTMMPTSHPTFLYESALTYTPTNDPTTTATPTGTFAPTLPPTMTTKPTSTTSAFPQSQLWSEFCMDPVTTRRDCTYFSDAETSVCPAGTVLNAQNEKRTIDATIVCPTGTLSFETKMNQEVPIEVIKKGLCSCKVGLFDESCEVLEEDLECECYLCPSGAITKIGYRCNKEIFSGCKSLGCDGTCFSDVPLNENPSESPSVSSSVSPTKQPTTSPSPTAIPEPSSSQVPSSSLGPSSFPFLTPSPSGSFGPSEASNSPTKRVTTPTAGPTFTSVPISTSPIDETLDSNPELFGDFFDYKNYYFSHRDYRGEKERLKEILEMNDSMIFLSLSYTDAYRIRLIMDRISNDPMHFAYESGLNPYFSLPGNQWWDMVRTRFYVFLVHLYSAITLTKH